MVVQSAQAQDLLGGTLYGANGEKIGKIGQVFLDDHTGSPEWVTVSTGLFGRNETFVPIGEGTVNGSDLTVSYDKDTIKNAPNVDPDGGHLSEAEEQELYRYYGRSYSAGGDATTGYTDADRSMDTGYSTGLDSGMDSGIATGTGTSAGIATGSSFDSDESFRTDESAGGMRTGAGMTEGYDTSGPTTDDAMTRSEERLQVGTERVEAGRARLRKYVTTEQETRTVPVSREHVVVEREPITDANRDSAMAGPDISEEEHEVVLTEERPVVTTETVPVERVRLGTETEVSEETVTGEVRKEQIDITDPQTTSNRRS